MLTTVPTVSDDDVVDVLADVGGLVNLDYRQPSGMVSTMSLLLLTVLTLLRALTMLTILLVTILLVTILLVMTLLVTILLVMSLIDLAGSRYTFG